ncbi:hypothetical protein C9374_001812 [Naegleria lovaniensis]|uniref:Uncharacterized protein n=1 Tax=Naegleria lovaniensis TaxID=51637 RepID=A0AA88GV45_NAELO|nr:uncharacterized protein C9374_001812 [Naegleria lovaniensis]KAG2387480.1 hypothetical protein C9374_001812 [Naegleria lovaniensis]
MFDWIRFVWLLIVVFLFKSKQHLLLTRDDLLKQEHFPTSSRKKKDDDHDISQQQHSQHHHAPDVYHSIIPTSKHITHYLVTPLDVDWNLHLNNAQYLTALEFARISYGFTTQMWTRAKSVLKANPLLMGISFQFRRDVGMFRWLRIESQVISYDDRFMYLEQTCFVGGQRQFVGRGLARIGFAGKKGLLNSSEWAPIVLCGENEKQVSSSSNSERSSLVATLSLDQQLEKVKSYIEKDKQSMHTNDEHAQANMAREALKRLERVKSFVEHDSTLKE